MGIEKDQLIALTGFFHGQAPVVTPDMLTGRFTPNQQWLALAVALAKGEPDAPARILTAYSVMGKVGHQAVGTGYGNEQGCPDPHSGLWAGAHGYILWWAMTHRHSALLLAAIDYWAAHVALCREFWTPAGLRMPCARAIFTLAHGAQTASPRPNWTCDSRLYDLITGGSTSASAAKAKYGNVAPPDQIAYDLLQACGQFFVDIRAKAATAVLKLAVPIRRWATVDGFDAAMDHDEPMNDRMSWIAVDKRGVILGSGNTLDTFHPPSTYRATMAPDIIGGPGGTVVKGDPAALPASLIGGAGPAPAPSGGTYAPRVAIIGPVGEMVGGVGRKPSLWQRIVAFFRGL